jgi:hypothetical protein
MGILEPPCHFERFDERPDSWVTQGNPGFDDLIGMRDSVPSQPHDVSTCSNGILLELADLRTRMIVIDIAVPILLFWETLYRYRAGLMTAFVIYDRQAGLGLTTWFSVRNVSFPASRPDSQLTRAISIPSSYRTSSGAPKLKEGIKAQGGNLVVAGGEPFTRLSPAVESLEDHVRDEDGWDGEG